ncbi:MAG: hypothetical protein Tsb009_06750 [Planctomycetaceae bacterium]
MPLPNCSAWEGWRNGYWNWPRNLDGFRPQMMTPFAESSSHSPKMAGSQLEIDGNSAIGHLKNPANF